MDVERLKKIEAIFHEVVDLEPDARRAAIDFKCAGNQEMIDEVNSLIAADSDDSRIISGSAESIIEQAFGGSISSERSVNLIGREIEQYRIVSVIGEGGMGKVYLARDSRLERDVAVKFLSEQFAGDRIRRERFFREAKSASALNHPNILTVHEIGEHDGHFFIVSEFVRGRTLKSILADGALAREDALDAALQIGSALAAAHEAGIVHRDVKPDNVMIRSDKLVKVLDFGIAKLAATGTTDPDTEAETRLDAATLPGMIIGTPQYMSPEQARGQSVDQRSDIFSFGVLLYEMLAGKPPFKGTTNIDTIGSILKDEPEALSTLVDDIPYELERIVGKCLRKDRETRYQHIKDLNIDLSDLRRTVDAIPLAKPSGTLAEAARVTSDDLRAVGNRHRLMYFVLGGMLVAALAAAYFAFFRTKNNIAVNELRTVEAANWSSTPGEIYSIGALSPDAKTLAFSSTKGGTMNIWVKQVASGEAVQITKDESASKNPIWSPNGEEIAFFSNRSGQAGIWRIPRLGGSPQLVTEFNDRGLRLRTWARSERIYFESNGEIFAVNSVSAKPEKITSLSDSGVKAQAIAVSPDEKRIAYSVIQDQRSEIWIASLDGKGGRRIIESENSLRNPVWHSDSERLFYSASVGGTFQIFGTDSNGSNPVQLTNSENDCLVLDSSADGTKVLFGTAKEESDIWMVGLDDKKESSVASAIDSELWPDVSPADGSLAYQSIKYLSQGNKIFNGRIVGRAVGSDTESTIAENASLPTFSPDGKLLAFFELVGKSLRIKVVRTSGGEARQISNDSVSMISYSVLPYNRTQASEFDWSPESDRIAYVSEGSGQSNIWVARADGSANVQITSANGEVTCYSPIWSRDGKRIAFLTKTNNTEGAPTFVVSIANAETKAVDPIWSGTSFMRLIGWSADDKQLIIGSVARGGLAANATQVTVSRIDIAAKATKGDTLIENAYLHNLHLSPDRATLAFAGHRDGRDNIWVVPVGGGSETQLTANRDQRLYFSSLAWAPDGKKIYFGKQSRFSLISMLTNFK